MVSLVLVGGGVVGQWGGWNYFITAAQIGFAKGLFIALGCSGLEHEYWTGNG